MSVLDPNQMRTMLGKRRTRAEIKGIKDSIITIDPHIKITETTELTEMIKVTVTIEMIDMTKILREEIMAIAEIAEITEMAITEIAETRMSTQIKAKQGRVANLYGM